MGKKIGAIVALPAAGAMFFATQAFAGLIVEPVDLTGAISDGTLANPGQVTTVNIDAPAGLTVVNFQWVLVFEAFAPSWGSEARILIESPDGDSFTFSGAAVGWGARPGFFFHEGSTSAFNGGSLAGDWTFTFYESFDDGISPDGEYLLAFFGISAIPAPGVLALLGLAGLCGTRRRRSA